MHKPPSVKSAHGAEVDGLDEDDTLETSRKSQIGASGLRKIEPLASLSQVEFSFINHTAASPMKQKLPFIGSLDSKAAAIFRNLQIAPFRFIGGI